MPVLGHRVGGGPGGIGAPVVLEHVTASGGLGQPDRARRAVPVVAVLVPLVADDVAADGRRCSGGQGRDPGVAPEAHLPVSRTNPHVDGAAVGLEDRAAQGVLGSTAVAGRAESRIPPRPGPRRGGRVDDAVRMGLLVADERPVGRPAAVDAVLPAGLPEDLVPAEEGEVDPGGPRGLDVGPLPARPVLVVSHREERGVLEQLGAASVGVDPRCVADVVAVGLQPADHGVLGVEDPVLVGVSPRGEGPVVADLVGAPIGSAGVETVAAVLVVRLPGRVRGLEEELRPPVVVPDDEEDVAGASRAVRADELGEVDPGNRVGRHRPRGVARPVAAVDQSRRGLGETGRLVVDRGGVDRRHLAGAAAAVVAHPVDVEAVRRRRGVHLEPDGLSLVDTHLGGEALDGAAAGAGDVPLALGAARLGVLTGHRADDRHVTGRRTGGPRG